MDTDFVRPGGLEMITLFGGDGAVPLRDDQAVVFYVRQISPGNGQSVTGAVLVPRSWLPRPRLNEAAEEEIADAIADAFCRGLLR